MNKINESTRVSGSFLFLFNLSWICIDGSLIVCLSFTEKSLIFKQKTPSKLQNLLEALQLCQADDEALCRSSTATAYLCWQNYACCLCYAASCESKIQRSFQVGMTVGVLCELRALLSLFLTRESSPPVLGASHCRKTATCLRGLVIYYQVQSKRNLFSFIKTS